MTDVTIAERLYRQSQDAILGLITAENADTPVPACPGWTVKDVLGHLTGALIDLSTGRTDGAPTPAWTASHIERYRETSLEDLTATWRNATDSKEAKSLFANMGVNLLPDIVTHEFDIRGALGNRDGRDSEALHAIYPVVISWLNGAFRQKQLRSITLGTEVEPEIVGDGMPQASVSSTMFELSRVFTGRRSPSQIGALEWSVDPSPWLDHLSVLGARETDLIE